MFWLPFLAIAAVSAGASYVTAKSNQAAAEDQQQRAIAEQQRVDAENIAENRRTEELNRLEAARIEALNIAENERVTEGNRKLAREYAEMDHMGRLVTESESAGFNPLTVMRAGGLSAITNLWGNAMGVSQQHPTVAQGSAPSQPYYRNPVPQAFIPNTGMALGSAFSAAANVMSGAVSQNASNVNSRELLAMQLSNDNAQRAAIRGITGGGSAALASRSTQAAVLAGLPSNWDAGDVTVTNPHPFAGVDPLYADAESMEARYGEPGSWLFGIRNMIADGVTNVTGITRADRRTFGTNAFGSVSNFVGGLADYRSKFVPPPRTGGSFGGQTQFSTGGAW